MKLQNIDYSLYLVTDRGLAGGRSTLEIVKAAVQGGVTCVQLRKKDCSTLNFIEQAFTIKDLLKARDVPLIINDRVDVALAIEADGVHLGQTDMPLAIAKKIVGDSMIIGISAESLEDALAAEKGGAVATSGDYERFFIKDGIRYHHILDPETGFPARGSRSVTIVADDPTGADALSTAVFVMGADKGMKLVEATEGVEAVIVDSSGNVTVSLGLQENCTIIAPGPTP